MTPKKKQLMISALIVVLLAVFSFVIYGTYTGNQASETQSTAKKSDTVSLSIENGASAANSNYAVNGLHVYDPTTEDMEDFVDGAEVKKGTKVSIYVYNLASDVHLYIEHDGKVIADKDYAVLKSDDDVEFFDIELKGDLKVVTTVANTKAAQKIAPIYVNDDKLATLKVDGKEVATGDEIAYGQHTFTVTALEKDITSTLKVSDKEIETVTIKAGNSHTYDKVAVDGTVFLQYGYANKADAEAAKAAKAAGTAISPANQLKQGQTANQDGYTVQISNQTSEQLDIRYLDDDMNVHNVISGNRYPKNLEVYSRVINKSSRRLVLTATLDGNVVGSTAIEPKPANDDATYFGLESIKLTGQLVYTLSYAGSSTGGGNAGTGGTSSTIPVNPIVTPMQPGGQTTPTNPSAPNTPNKPSNPAVSPTQPSTKMATITINDGAKKANTDYAVNGLHVYSQGYNNNNNFKSGDKVPIGTKITIYEYNLASSTNLKVIHNGKVIADKNYDILKSDADVDFIEFTVEGDVTVTTSVGKKTPSTPKEDPVLPADKTYQVLIDNPLDQVTVNASYVDMSSGQPKSIKIQSGEAVKSDTGIYIQALNPTNDRLKLTAYLGNKAVASTTIEAKPDNEDYAAGGLMGDDYQGIPLTDQMRIVVEKIPTKAEHSITLSGLKKDAVDVYYNNKQWTNGEKLPAGTYTFNIYNKDYDDTEREVTLKVNGTVVAKKTASGYNSADFTDIQVNGNVEFVVNDKDTMATITINDHAKALNSNTAVNGLHVYSPGYNNNNNFKSGDQMPIGTKISVYEYNYASPVRITIELNGKTIVDEVQDYIRSDADIQFFDFELTGDLVVTTTAVETDEKTPKLHIENPSLGYVYNAATYQEYADQAPLSLGTTSFIIYSDKDPVDVTVSSNGKIFVSQRLEANKSMDLTDFNVTGDVTVSFQKAAAATSYQLRITGDAKDAISITEGSKIYTADSSISAGSHSLSIYNANYDETTYSILVKINGKEVSKGSAFEYVSFDTTIDVTGDVEIIANKEKPKHTVTLTGTAKDKVKLYIGTQELTSGSEIEEGTVNFYVYAIDDEASYKVTVKKNGTVLSSQEASGYLSADFEGFLVDADIEFDISPSDE